jgi:hypothetical protein
MRKDLLAVAIIGFPLTVCAQATSVDFTATHLSGSTWRYDYLIANNTLGTSIDEVTIFFRLGLFENLSSPRQPAAWNSVLAQPDPGLPADGFYDSATTGSGIAPGGSLAGFSVTFTYLGSGTPGSQPFDIVNPVTFATLDNGQTQRAGATGVPEPGPLGLVAAALLGGGAGSFCRRRRRHLPTL